MPGAQIAIDQDRPGPSVSTGTPGYGRDDLWLGRATHPRSVNTATLYAWTLLDKPPGSAAVLTDATQQTCTITPDLAGSYRLELVIDGGGLGNTQVKILACVKDVNGVETNNGWRFPALGENPEEANFGGQSRGWDEALRNILTDLLTVGGGSVEVKDEGSSLGTTFTAFDFAGPGVVATDVGGGVALVTVAGFSPPTGTGFATTTGGALDVAALAFPLGFAEGGTGLSALGTAYQIPRVNAGVTAIEWFTPLTPLPVERVLVGSLSVVDINGYVRIGARQVDMSKYPVIPGKTRSVKFVADLDIAGAATNAQVKLSNITDLEDVTGADLTSTSVNNEELSATLTVGSGAGNLRDDHVAQYEVYLRMNGGTPLTDFVNCTNARLVIEYT